MYYGRENILNYFHQDEAVRSFSNLRRNSALLTQDSDQKISLFLPVAYSLQSTPPHTPISHLLHFLTPLPCLKSFYPKGRAGIAYSSQEQKTFVIPHPLKL